MSSSVKSRRWMILALVASVVLLLRLFRGELLQGKNPLLVLLPVLAIYMAFRLGRRK